MLDKAKHAFGSLSGVQDALANGLIDAYDILFLDGETDPKVGWIDKNGKLRIVKGNDDVYLVEGSSLPSVGQVGKVYIFNDEVYIWNGAMFKLISKTNDLTYLENKVTELSNQLAQKVDEKIVREMIDSSIAIVEF